MPRKLSHKILILLFAASLGSCTTTPPPRAPSTAVYTPELQADHALMDDGYELPLQVWNAEQPKAVVLALHGFNDYHRAFETVGPALAERGIVTYAYDQRGFGATEDRGQWAGTDRMMDDTRIMVSLLRDRHPGLPVYLLGESMGGAVSLTTVANVPGDLVDGVVLVAPAVWARTTMPWYQRAALAVARAVAPGWRPTGRSLGKQASDNIPMLRALGRDPLVIKETRIDTVAGLADLMDVALASAPRLHTPTLVLYGERDEIVPKRPTCQMLNTLPDPQKVNWRLGLYPDGYHMLTRDLKGERVVEDIAGWILDHDQPLVSGADVEPRDWNERICTAEA